MELIIRTNTDLLNMHVLEGIQKIFPHKDVEIKIQEEDGDEPEDVKEREG